MASQKLQVLIGVVALVSVLGASGCTSQVDGEIPTAASSPVASQSLKVLSEYSAKAGASGNQGLFNDILEPLWQGDKAPTTQQVKSALSAKGFPEKKLTITPDKTPEGRATDSKEVAIKIGDQCLVGQYVQGYRSLVMEPVYGKCLIGDAEN